MEAAQNWAVSMTHACLWGSLAVAAVGVVCRCLPRLPAPVRAWLWWLACAKLLAGLWIAAPISLPVLPAPAPVVHFASAVAMASAAHVSSPIKPGASAVEPAFPEVEARAVPASPAPRWPLLLFALWILGVAASFAAAALQSVTLKRLQRGTFSAPLPDIDLDALAKQMGLRRTPRVLTGPNIQTPCVTGWLRPAILLPLDLNKLTPTELRLTLAHEMAHLKRYDLPLALMPMLTRTLFFFDPFVWWATAEWAAAREEACDGLALAATQIPSADYGRLLLKLASPAASPPALGLSPGYSALRRRLVSLAYARPAPRGARLLVLAVPLLLPWRLSAALPTAALNPDKTPTYSVTPLAGDADSQVNALNNAGQVALSVRAEGGTQGYAGNVDALAPMDALPKHHASLAYGLNDLGQAAGASFNIPGHARAFLWDGATHKIGSLPGYPYSEARGINSAGQIAGFSETGHADRRRAWISRAFLHKPGEALTDLGTLGGPYSAAYAVNALGTVVGKADTEQMGATHAFAWADGQMTDLGTLGGANSVAYAVSDAGTIAGASDVDDTGTRHAFLYAGDQMQDLAPLPGMTGSAAYALNASGQVVGTSQTSSLKHATLWQNGPPTDLNSLLPPNSGWTLTEARAINDHGQIAGLGLFQGRRRAFLLTPR